ncbi:hypothetical protein ABT336_26960, partial [Micromonospora sp. NPDC000207]|uniref:hypothetical protein n=1 Tax=Micromonospora sp. NPDC000207 TaxID=3154246 RepID=UPI00331D5560
PRRHRVGEQLRAARIHPVRVEAHRIGATLVVLLVPYLIGQAVAFAVTARTFPPGVHLWAGYLLLGVFGILVAVALGWACGLLLGPVFAPLTAALGFLLLITLLPASGFSVVSGRPEVAVDPVVLSLALGLAVALLLTMVWLPAGTGPGRAPCRAVALVPAALGLAVLVGTTAMVTDREPPGDRALCVEGSTTICIWPEQEKYLPGMRVVLGRVDQLPAVFARPERINEYGLQQAVVVDEGNTEPVIGEGVHPYFSIMEGSPWSYAGDIGKAITSRTFGFLNYRACSWERTTDADVVRLSTLDKWLEAYLVGASTPDYQTNAPAALQEAWAKGRALAAESPQADQFRWAESEVKDLRGRYCQPQG